MSYAKDQANAVFLVKLVDQYGDPVTGITAPTVKLSKSQGADTITITWVETTDFTWHELTSGDHCKGCYKLRQVDSPNVDAVDTAGACLLTVYKTDYDTAVGELAYRVEDRSASGGLAAAFADAVWDEARADHVSAASTGEALQIIKAVLAHQMIHHRDELNPNLGERHYYNEAGDTVIHKMRPVNSDDATKTTREVLEL